MLPCINAMRLEPRELDAVSLLPIDDDLRALVNIAYRMLGSHSEAKDVVSEGVARWFAMSETRRREVRSIQAWLTTTVTRICLDNLRSARVRRETYVGVWLPEPAPAASVAESPSFMTDPLDQITLDESVRMALLVLLESLTPAERVVFVLHEAFAYRFREISEIVGRSPEACRQLAFSARTRLKGLTRPSDPTQHRQAVSALKRSWESNDIAGLVTLLDPDVVATTDGGGVVQAAVNPIRGSAAVARSLATVLRRYQGIEIQAVDVNGEPGLVTRDVHGGVLAVLGFAVVEDRVRSIWVIRNPTKLHSW